MDIERSKSGSKVKRILLHRWGSVFQWEYQLYDFLAPRAYSVIIFAALFCNMAAKFFHCRRISLTNQYFNWIFTDVAVLLTIEVVLAAVCFRWPRKSIIRIATVIAAVICTWSVMNAGWLIRTGTQILPTVLSPLFRHPLNTLSVIGVNLAKMPIVAIVLLAPSAIALTFFFCVLAKPKPLIHSRKYLLIRFVVSASIIFTVLIREATTHQGSSLVVSQGLRYNCQLRAVTCFLMPKSRRLAKADLINAKRKIPSFDQIEIKLRSDAQKINHNVVLVVLEGVQYQYTSLANEQKDAHFAIDSKVPSPNDLTPHLAALAKEGVEFSNMRSSLTHTTKVLFSLMTGRLPSASHDIVETVPLEKPYAGIPTILKQKFNFRTAFFQSAKGNFEARPGLVYNLGFDKFWARDNLENKDSYLGYLACDEFAMIKPITEWIKADDKPFFLTILCSVTHDPYEVPEWFATPAKESTERYRQAILYTDKFIAQLDAELVGLNLADKTIFCVVGDHGEAFGEHGLHGHERITFEEALHIPWVMRAPALIEPQTKITEPVSSIDFAPTLLNLFGFDIEAVQFDGLNVLATPPKQRKVYFSGWLYQSPAGFIKAEQKYMYNPVHKTLFAYDLNTDPFEQTRIELPSDQTQEIIDDIIKWRKSTIFKINQHRTGKKILFTSWLCRWTNRISSAKYIKNNK